MTRGYLLQAARSALGELQPFWLGIIIIKIPTARYELHTMRALRGEEPSPNVSPLAPRSFRF